MVIKNVENSNKLKAHLDNYHLQFNSLGKLGQPISWIA